jgi:hypothetical protein
MMKKTTLLLMVFLIALSLAACQGRPDLSVNDLPDNTEPGQGEGDGQSLPANAQRSIVYLEEAQILILESYPVQVKLSLGGELPTPCHQLQVEFADPDAEFNIYVDVYSLVDPEVMCAQVLESFAQSFTIPMQGKEDGQYRVYVNGELVGEFSYPG